MRTVYRYKKVTLHGHPKSDSQGHVLEHVVIAERAVGHALPDLAEVHHVDENTMNNANGNLVICQDRAYHKLLHVRARVVRAGGDPNTERICTTCRVVKSFAAFNKWSGNIADGLQRRCRVCQSKHCKGYVRPAKRMAA